MTEPHRHRSTTTLWRRVGRGIAALCAVAAMAWFSTSLIRSPTAAGGMPDTLPQTARVVARPLVQTVDLAGTLRSSRVVDIVAPFDATVLARPVAWGEAAAQGAILLELSTVEIDSQVREAESALHKAEQAAAELRDWPAGLEVQRARRALGTAQSTQADGERRLAEAQRLLALGIVPRTEVEDLQAQQRQVDDQAAAAREELTSVLRRGAAGPLRIAELELENARLKVGALQSERARRVLTLPFAGIVAPAPVRGNDAASASVEVGSRVRRGDVLMRVLAQHGYALHAVADELDVTRIQPGQPASVTLTALPRQSFMAHVAAVTAPLTTEPGREGEPARYEVRLLLEAPSQSQPSPSAQLRPGLSGQARIEVYRREQALLVPMQAVMHDDAGAHVTLRTAGGALRRVPVRTGVVGPQDIEVFGDLAPHAELWTGPHDRSSPVADVSSTR